METLTTRIHRVTVYRNGALVTRRGTANSQDVEVRGLPLLFSSDSLRVRAETGRVLEVRDTCGLDVVDPGSPAEAQQLAERALAVETLKSREKMLLTMRKALEGVTPVEPGSVEADKLPDATLWLTVRQQVAEQLRSLDDELRDVRVQLEAAVRRHQQAQQAAGAEKVPPRFFRGVQLRLSASPPGIHVELEYFIEAARWVPTYALRLDGGEASLTLSAMVAQATGEAWDGVALQFSTADLNRDATLPELTSWRLGRAQGPQRPAFRPLPRDLEALFAGHDLFKNSRPMDALQPLVLGATMALPMSPSVDEDEGGGDDFDRHEPTGEMMMEELSAPPAPEAADEPAPLAKRRMESAKDMKSMAPAPSMQAMGGAMPRRPGAAPSKPKPAAPPEPLPPRLRYAWLRLAGPDEAMRGTLQPMDPFAQLWSLVQGAGATDPQLLRRALDAIREAQGRLRSLPLPPGTTALEGQHFHHVHQAPGVHALASDGNWHGVSVGTHQGPAQLEYRTVPRSSEDVYRFCLLQTPSRTPFPHGPLQVYVDGSFRVTAQLKGSGGGIPLELNLGVDPDVRVVGRTVHVNQEEKGLVSQNSRVDHKVKVELLSTQAAPVKVVVWDRMPQPADNEKDLAVQLVSSSPEATKLEKSHDGTTLKGALRWSLTLQPNKQETLEYHYQVVLPAKSEVNGGNRRE